MMRINIFRNPHIDAQVGYLMDSLVSARRKETEAYWRGVVTKEILDIIHSLEYDSDYCKIIHSCDLIDEIVLGVQNEKP